MNKITVLDIETFPDTIVAERARVDLSDRFPPWPFHQLACASVLTIYRDDRDKPTFEIETFSRETLGERGIVCSVERAIEGSYETITYNGAGFDIPVLMARAAVTCERAPTIAKLAAQTRFRPGTHIDLLQEITGYGAAPRIRLSDICAAFAIPVKIDAAGSDVCEMINQGKFARVSAYCETDVVATWLAYEHWRSIQRDDPERVLHSWAALTDWIRDNLPHRFHLAHYAQPSDRPAGGKPMGNFDGYDTEVCF